jgi:replicative DNA helicase
VPSFFLPRKNLQKNLDWIKDRIKEGILKYGVDVVYIDYLHFLVEFSRITNSSLVIGGVMRELKMLAINEGLIMFLVVPPTKVEQYKKIKMHQMRDSSLIQHTADIIMSINRIREGTRITDTGALHILKHRRTGKLTKNEGITLKHVDGLFKELSNI